MKKSLFFLIVLSISLLYSENSFSQNSLIVFQYALPEAGKMNIKSVKVFKSENQEAEKLYKIFNYDYINNEIEETDEKFLYTRHKIKYDSKGNYLYRVIYSGDVITFKDSTARIYNDDSLLIKYYYFSRNEEELNANLPSKLVFTEKYKYNRDKKVIEKTRMEKDSIVSERTLYNYSSGGIITGGEVYDGNNLLIQQLYYDEAGNLIKIENLSSDTAHSGVKYYILKYNSIYLYPDYTDTVNQRYYFAGFNNNDEMIFENEDHLNIIAVVGETIYTEWNNEGEKKITRLGYEYEYRR